MWIIDNIYHITRKYDHGRLEYYPQDVNSRSPANYCSFSHISTIGLRDDTELNVGVGVVFSYFWNQAVACCSVFSLLGYKCGKRKYVRVFIVHADMCVWEYNMRLSSCRAQLSLVCLLIGIFELIWNVQDASGDHISDSK